MHKQSNPIVWGAWGGIVFALIATLGQLAGEPLGGTAIGYGAGGFFWLWVVANIKNRLAGRRPRT